MRKNILINILFIFLIVFLSCKKDSNTQTPSNPNGNLSPYVGTWKGQTYYYCSGGYSMTLTIQNDGKATGILYIHSYMGSGIYYDCASNLTGEAWANKQPYRFYSELQESCLSSKMYLGGSLKNDSLIGWLGDGKPLANPPDNCFLFMLKKQ